MAVVFSESFDNPAPPDGRVLYSADAIYDAIPGPETGGTSTGNNFENGYIVASYDTVILSDQSGSGFFLHNRTGGGGGPFNGKVWGTIAPVPVDPQTTYEFSFYLTNENTINNAIMQPTINGVAVGSPVTAAGTFLTNGWQQFTVSWDSGSASTAELALVNLQSWPDGFGDDFGLDGIELTGPAQPPVLSDLVGSSFHYRVPADATGEFDGPLPFNASFDLFDNNAVPRFKTSVANAGQATAGQFTVGIYASQDSTISTADVLIGQFVVPALLAGAEVEIPLGNLTLPDNATTQGWIGQIHIGMVIDPDNDISELIEGNNSNQGAAVDFAVVQLYDALPAISEIPSTFGSRLQAQLFLLRNGFFPQFPGTGGGWTKLLPVSSTFASRFDGVIRSGFAYRLDATIRPPDAAHGGRYWIEVRGSNVLAEPAIETAILYGFDWFNYVLDWHRRF
jgi:hypothetical protein